MQNVCAEVGVPLPHKHTPVHTHSSHSHTGTHDVRLEIWPNNPTNVRISRHSNSIRSSLHPFVRPFVPFVQPGAGQACVLNDISCQRALADGNGAVPGVRGRG